MSKHLTFHLLCPILIYRVFFPADITELSFWQCRFICLCPDSLFVYEQISLLGVCFVLFVLHFCPMEDLYSLEIRSTNRVC